ncbi:hypothetical protein IV500_06150 [Paeniglutamicibacter antarcticus]|uniref:Uncharacterized protein n=1 Tax=Arthrobacter terrae TaxID=2935737 RepID=A0A931CM50_9MICC|nr:hypothetical protein [Arthrobacter terrae]MBG0739005.1 hypothetical protein [Arthrobacter terrae]
MKFGSSIALFVFSAILCFAIDPALSPNFNFAMVGYTLMGACAVGLIAALAINAPRRTRRVTETWSVVDPATGERIVRNESRDSAL